ncbi:uncharacterized protein LOC141647597 [Silene latifolia]|uniref:uncharacterized protein LOC141647597 n=1 Tax=Silene latifolia TaxID=37657 RepID=UPI003D77349D
MAYRRRQVVTRGSTFKEQLNHDDENDDDNNDADYKSTKNFNHNYSFPGINNNNINNNENGSLAARAIRASAAHRDTVGYGYAYASPSLESPSSPASSSYSSFSHRRADHFRSNPLSKGSFPSESTSTKDPNDPKYGFWGILARKAKSILDEDDEFESSNRMRSTINTATGNQFYYSRQPSDSGSRIDNAKFRKGIDAITSSLNNLGGTLGNAFEEGRTIVEHKTADIIQETRNKTADIIQETRRLQIRRRGGGNSDSQDQATVLQNTSWQRPVFQPVQTSALANQETQLKASRDVAMATAAKAKVLLRELKTVKADLAFAKERCSQLEEENKRLRESRDKGDNPADDDLIRLQLETLLAEKARLAHENSIYARENRFLREIVEYHQLTMQDIIYVDEGAEEVTEVYSIDDAKVLSSTPTSPMSPSFHPDASFISSPTDIKEHTREVPKDVSSTATPLSPPEVPTASVLPERTESSKVSIPSHTLVTVQNNEATCNTLPPISVADDHTKTSFSST